MSNMILAVNTLTGVPALIPEHYLFHPTFGKNYKLWGHPKKNLAVFKSAAPRKSGRKPGKEK